MPHIMILIQIPLCFIVLVWFGLLLLLVSCLFLLPNEQILNTIMVAIARHSEGICAQ